MMCPAAQRPQMCPKSAAGENFEKYAKKIDDFSQILGGFRGSTKEFRILNPTPYRFAIQNPTPL